MKFEEPVELTNKTSITNIIDNYDTNSCWDELIKYYDIRYNFSILKKREDCHNYNQSILSNYNL